MSRDPSKSDVDGVVFKVGGGATSRGNRGGADISTEYALVQSIRRRAERVIVFTLVLNSPPRLAAELSGNRRRREKGRTGGSPFYVPARRKLRLEGGVAARITCAGNHKTRKPDATNPRQVDAIVRFLPLMLP